jgi:hypothetical protein
MNVMRLFMVRASGLKLVHVQDFCSLTTVLQLLISFTSMYVEGMGQKSGPCTATFNDLLCFHLPVKTRTMIQNIIYLRHYHAYHSVLLWLYSPLLGIGHFFILLMYTQSVGLLGRRISPSQGRYQHTEQHKHRINAHRHPCLK